jgi:Family of unknown function (DUF6232)
MDEKIFYDLGGVKVTNSRFIVDSATYPIANISSVKASSKEPNKSLSSLCILVGVLFMLAVFSDNSWLAVIGLFFVWLGIELKKTAKGTYKVVLTTSGSEVQAYSAPNSNIIANIIKALNDAIVYRG